MSIFFSKNKVSAIRIYNPEAKYYKTIDEELARKLGKGIAKLRIPEEHRNKFTQAQEPGEYWTHRKTAQALVRLYPGVEIVELG